MNATCLQTAVLLHLVRNASIGEILDANQELKEQGPWVPGANQTEVPFLSRSGKYMLYCYQPSTGRHAYLDCGTDLILSDEDAGLALRG